MPSWLDGAKEGEMMNGVTRFLSKREKKHKPSKGRNVSSELYKVFSVEDNKDGKKKTAEEKKIDKEEERKVKILTLRLTRLGIANLQEAQIEYALQSKSADGDVDKALSLLQTFEDSVEGIVREYDPAIKLVGAENRQAVTCYLDALLFAMFARLDSFEALLFDTFTDTPRKKLAETLRLWVNMLRSGKLITTDITKQLQEALAECGWADAAELHQQDTSEAFAFITDKLQLPLLTLKMDIYHFGKEDLTDDHKVVHERLLEVAIPDPPESGGSVTLEECLENYFNNKVEVKRLLNRRNTLQSMRSYDASKSQTVHIETTELRSRSPSPASPLPKSPMALKSPTSPTSPTSPSTPTSPKRPLSSRHRTDSIFGEKRVETGHIRKAQDDASVTSGRQRAGTIRKEVLMPAWQFFSLIPWYTDTNPTSDAQVAAHFQTKRPVLGICLKRYEMDEHGVTKRKNTQIDIPLEIALPEFVSDEHVAEDFGDFKLSLESVVCHRGVSTDAGHYVSLVRGVAPKPSHTAEGQYRETPWMRFDDLAKERITPVNIKTALKEESPYLLFYQVQPTGEDVPPTYAEANAEAKSDPPPIATGTIHPASRPNSSDNSRTDLSPPETAPSTASTIPSLPSSEILVTTPSGGSTDGNPFTESTNTSKSVIADAPTTEVNDFDATGPTPASTTSTATHSTVDLTSEPHRGRTSLDPGRRSSVAFNDASTSAGTATPSAAGSIKTTSTAPPTPADEGKTSWLGSVGSRRNSRTERRSRPSSQSGENRLSLTMSKLSAKMSKDKLLAGLTGSNGNATSNGASNGHPEEEPVITVAEVGSEAPSRVSTSMLTPKPVSTPKAASTGTSPARTPEKIPAPEKRLSTGPVEVKGSSSIGRSKSLRHRKGLSLGGHEDKKDKRSRSRGRYLTTDEAIAAARSSMEVDGRPVTSLGFDERDRAKAKKKGQKPDRECIVM